MAELTETRTIDAHPEKVWKIAGDPAKISEWLPLIERSQLEGDRRECAIRDGGGEIVERITSRSDDGLFYEYEILESPLPLRSYRSRFALEEHDGHTHVNWVAIFEPEDPSAEQELRGMFSQTYRDGLDRLAELATATEEEEDA